MRCFTKASCKSGANPISLTSLFGPLPDCFFIASETFIDQFSCLFVVTGQHVSVRVQSNRSIRVSQSLLNGFERDALSQPMRCTAMAKVVKANSFEADLRRVPCICSGETVRLPRGAIWERNDQVKICFKSLPNS